MKTRKIKKTYAGVPTVEGAGVNLLRIFSQPDVKELDPFLLLDFFDSDDPVDYMAGFPMHPHRGIETITYLIKGHIDHEDSLGNRGTIGPLECQWMTAGRSIYHQEMPRVDGPILGTQLWLNLPRAHKMTPPTYRDLKQSDLPKYEISDVSVRILSGTFRGITGPVKGTYVNPQYFDVTVNPRGTFSADVPMLDTVFIFLLSGSLSFPQSEPTTAAEVRGILLSEGDYVSIHSTNGARFLMISGRPLSEPVAWGGPIVMNTQEELQEAFRQIKNGTFIQT